MVGKCQERGERAGGLEEGEKWSCAEFAFPHPYQKADDLNTPKYGLTKLKFNLRQHVKLTINISTVCQNDGPGLVLMWTGCE